MARWENSKKLLDVEDKALSFQQELVYHSNSLARTLDVFRPRYWKAITEFPAPFRVKDLGDDVGFDVDVNARQITFNLAPIRMFHLSVHRNREAAGLSKGSVEDVKHFATEQFIAHELFHCGQNLMTMQDVRAIKSLASVDVLGEMDLIADMAAAKLVARLETARFDYPGTDLYLQNLQTQLRVMSEFAAKAFRAPMSKIHKVRRFVGLLLVSARIAEAQELSGNALRANTELPLDTPLLPYFDFKTGSMMIFALSPDRTIWRSRTSVTPRVLLQLCEELDTAPFALSLQRTMTLLREIEESQNTIEAS